MKDPVDRNAPSAEGRATAAAVLVAAAALALFGGAVTGFRRLPSPPDPAQTTLPDPQEPRGEVARPPEVFRWTPGGPDVDFSQVVVFNERYERIWQSAPVEGDELRVDPEDLFATIAAGQVLSWSVREVQRGHPRATSPVVDFVFLEDVHGRGIGESRPGNVLIRR